MEYYQDMEFQFDEELSLTPMLTTDSVSSASSISSNANEVSTPVFTRIELIDDDYIEAFSLDKNTPNSHTKIDLNYQTVSPSATSLPNKEDIIELGSNLIKKNYQNWLKSI